MKNIRKHLGKIYRLFSIGKGWHRVKLLFLYILYHFSSFPSFVKTKFFSLYVHELSDLSTLRSILSKDEYVFRKIQPKTIASIIDLGANIGVATLYFRHLYPDAHIHSFEPDRGTFVKLQQNTRGDKKISIYNIAISGKTGNIQFYANQQSVSSSMNQRNGATQETTVQALSLNEALDSSGQEKVDLIKFDIEGAEYDTFLHFNTTRAKYIIGEYHADLSHHPKEDFLSLFAHSHAHGHSKKRDIIEAQF